MRSKGKVIAIVGMQYGSEGKGAVSELLGHTAQVAIRIGGPNAGHTIYYQDRKYAMRHIPCCWTNPSCILLIGPAGIVSPEVLEQEIAQVETALGFPLAGRFFIHENVVTIEPRHIADEQDMDKTIGSTREGVGAATADRVMRTAFHVSSNAHFIANEYPWMDKYIISHEKYLDIVHGTYERGGTILLEGTQGHGLSLYHGPYPYTTSRDTSVGSLAGGCGIAPFMLTDVVGVLRTFPIRVGGNSGPLAYETNFADLDQPPEYTTVTGRMRRIGRFDQDAFVQAVKINGPNHLAITFLDYLPEVQRTPFIRHVESISGIPIRFTSWGPEQYGIDPRDALFNLARRIKDDTNPNYSISGRCDVGSIHTPTRSGTGTVVAQRSGDSTGCTPGRLLGFSPHDTERSGLLERQPEHHGNPGGVCEGYGQGGSGVQSGEKGKHPEL
jgi:adenylosuccinate synthase